VRVDNLVGEIVRLAPGQASNSEIQAALKDRTEFVRRKVGDHETITTRSIVRNRLQAKGKSLRRPQRPRRPTALSDPVLLCRLNPHLELKMLLSSPAHMLE